LDEATPKSVKKKKNHLIVNFVVDVLHGKTLQYVCLTNAQIIMSYCLTNEELNH